MSDSQDFNVFLPLFEQSSLGIIISNADGVMEKVNPFVAQMFGHTVPELEGQKIEILLPQNIRKDHIKYRKSYCQNPTPRAMGRGLDLHALRKDGSEFFVEVSLSFFEINNKLHVVSFVSDVSENRRIREELREQAEKLEELVRERTKDLSDALLELNNTNDDLKKEITKRKESEQKSQVALEREKELSELKSRFVSMASHEFRTPLGGILSSANLLEKYHDPEHLERREKHIKRIKKSVQNLTSILNDFLSLDKLEQGKIEPRPIEFNLTQFLLDVVDDVQEIYQEEEIEILPQVLDEAIICFQDQEMLRNILMNLLSNAVKYTRRGLPVDVVLNRIGTHAEIQVKDQGIGIPEVEQKHLFERFFRAKNATSIQGTGLGLNIVKKYLEYMDGVIDFESKENIGTTFTIKIPLELRT